MNGQTNNVSSYPGAIRGNVLPTKTTCIQNMTYVILQLTNLEPTNMTVSQPTNQQ